MDLFKLKKERKNIRCSQITLFKILLKYKREKNDKEEMKFFGMITSEISSIMFFLNTKNIYIIKNLKHL